MTKRLRITRELVGELTVGELEQLEERTGRPLSRLFDADAPRGILLHTLAYLQLRRDDPDMTWEDAADVVVELEDEPEVGTTTENPSPAGRGRRRG
jgi:diphthamide biosynthesis methyltransferase